MPASLRPFVWPVILVSCAALAYFGKVQREMADFEVYRTAAARVLGGEPIYRASDGHYQFKYLPASALAFTPFAIMRRETNSWRWPAFAFGYLLALAYGASFLTYRLIGWLA